MTQAVNTTTTTITNIIAELLQRRGATRTEITDDALLMDDLGMDSLELAELSAALEDDLGSDPFSQGILPRSVSELKSFYES